VKNADRYLARLLIPTNLNKLKQEDELHIYDAYWEDLQTQQEFTLEINYTAKSTVSSYKVL
jgi:hypothetical protein